MTSPSDQAYVQLRPGWFALLFTVLSITACEAGSGPEAVSSSGGTVSSFDGAPIAFDVTGTGSPALVLVHGWSCDRSYWSGQVDWLSASNTVVTIDLAGHGDSGLGRDDWTIASFGADVAAVVEHLDLDSVVLVGHSMGGDVVFQAARRLPGKVEALVMVDTYKKLGFWNTDSEIDEFAAEFASDFPGVTEGFVRGFFPPGADQALVDRVAKDMASAPPEVAISALRSSFRHAREIPGLIDELNIPIAAINPDDSPTDRESMDQFGVDVVIMPGVGHFLMMEEPERFNRLLLSTIDNLLQTQ